MSRIFAALLLSFAGCRGSCARAPDPASLELVLTGQRVIAGGKVRAIAVAKDKEGNALFAPEPRWSITGSATIERGFVQTTRRETGSSTSTDTLWITATLDQLTATASIAAIHTPAEILIDPSARLQPMLGWEVTAQVGQLECDPAAYSAHRDEIYDRTVDELGIDRVRLEFRANVEHPIDYTRRLLDGAIDFDTWAKHRYVSENDDADPSHPERARFQLTEIDHQIEHVVKPLAERLAKRGERLYLNACFVAFDADFHRDHPDEYAELVLVVFEHLRSRHGILPDALEVILEPDVAGWSAHDVARAIRAVGPRLDRAGFHPAIIAPSNTDLGSALDFLQTITADPEARRWLTDFAYHRYRGVYAENVELIGTLPARFGLRTMMLEHIDSSDRALHEDLAVAHSSAWQRFGLAFCPPGDDGSVHYLLGPPVKLARTSRFLPQYFRHVRRGAVRLFASSASKELEPLAFMNEGDRATVVVRTERAATVRMTGLPDSRYSAEYTTAQEFLIETDVIQRGGTIEATIPSAGVITIFTP